MDVLHPDTEYAGFLADGRFMIQRSRSSGTYVFYPRIAAPGTGARDLEWLEASGRGTVHAVTVIPKRDPKDSYNVVLVDLEEGPRMMSRIDDCANEDVRIGMAVTARIVTENGKPLLVFVPEAV
ncbi:Zn-ribbon domain-containing OB-fold protein [Tropicimonas isoalkanivorans]|uniref:ChsH2 C-terminal OB-fold domain-containing protein n=1 Tax=Tropicimonas isoalkanivorans TaxID=441112 RepID=A0A1I1HTQ0_9RHOB|nr:OB-fold domain-containing protein [Tropicimonas isoalkanivorans]SFC27241.1 hypothetical protein SAMN04488094_103279 [Tropicimonas isoalkanivorans]